MGIEKQINRKSWNQPLAGGGAIDLYKFQGLICRPVCFIAKVPKEMELPKEVMDGLHGHAFSDEPH